jgi:hypothetical protein
VSIDFLLKLLAFKLASITPYLNRFALTPCPSPTGGRGELIGRLGSSSRVDGLDRREWIPDETERHKPETAYALVP